MSIRYVWGQYTISQQYYTETGYRATQQSVGTVTYDLTSSNDYVFYLGSSYYISQSTGAVSISGSRKCQGGWGKTGTSYGSGYIQDGANVYYSSNWVARDKLLGVGFCVEGTGCSKIGSEMYQTQSFYNVRGTLIGYVSSSDSGAYPADSTRNNSWYTSQGSDTIDPNSVSIPETINGGSSIYVTIAPSSGQKFDLMTSFICQYRFNGGEWTNFTTTSMTQFILSIPMGTKTVQARVQAKDNGGFTSTTWVESPTVEVINGGPPTISSPLGNSPVNLGYVYEAFTFDYTVKDPDYGDKLTVVETLSDAGGKPYSLSESNIESGTTLASKVAAEDEIFQKIPNDTEVSISIQATDSNDLTSSVFQVLFKKFSDGVTITLKEPLSVRGSITEGVMYVTAYIPTDAEFKIEATNNAKDEEVVWQDVTDEVLHRRMFVFENASSDTDAAFNFMLTAKRGKSQVSGYIDEVAGAFK